MKKSYWGTMSIEITIARLENRPFSRVELNRGRFVKYSTFDGVIEHYGK